ncbi:DUF5718 family protein [Treponema sp.]|uniref:DUF5718 family protein n=1 Tax=Treponema sp. TaxID=166 RepID=UPI003F0A91EB
MEFNLNKIPCFGIAGNFTGHLEQAGEATDFQNVQTKEENAPKAIFPTYIPGAKSPVPDFLGIFPFSSESIIFPRGEEKLQIEPECAILCKMQWAEGRLKAVIPVKFGASNDCSIRKPGAKKISMKKNWGKCSKGLSENLISIDEFSQSGILRRYRIACFLSRGGKLFDYGEDSPVSGYNYIFEKLTAWIVETFNTQKDEGAAEDIRSYLSSTGEPETALISIGATRYTEFGEKTFIQPEDETIIVLYPQDKYTNEKIRELAASGTLDDSEVSILRQKASLI